MQKRSTGTALVSGMLALPMAAAAGACAVHQEESREAAMPTVTVHGRRVANDTPAHLYATVATAFRYDPEVDVQARGLAEGQADIAVRGGTFESTAVAVGAVTVHDPQTGHYTAVLPIDAAVLSIPQVRTDTSHALSGFNATLATVAYDWRPLTDYREVALGAGSDALRYALAGFADTEVDAAGGVTGIEARYEASHGDGSRANGDHRFERALLHLQARRAHSRSDVAVAYQDSFYGWPGAYTGFAGLPETDRTMTALLIANHRLDFARDDQEESFVDFGAYYRDLRDDYDFDRRTQESGAPGSFDHRTRSYGIGVRGRMAASGWGLDYAVQVSGDELLRSTDLNHGDFSSRRYLKATVLPEYAWMAGETDLSLRLGLTLDASDRDADAVSPVAALSATRGSALGVDVLTASIIESTQLPGYTALNSAPNGLFGGNAGLGRERATVYALRWERQRPDWHARATAHLRRDDALVDWTYLSGAPFARQANAVDLDVAGLDLLFSKRWPETEIVLGYSYLDKEADYGGAPVDASYYALNYATHRVTVALRRHLGERMTVSLDNEYRRQADHPLRPAGGDDAYSSSLALEWHSLSFEGLSAALIADNLTGSDFEEFPGTPAPGRQLSLTGRYRW